MTGIELQAMKKLLGKNENALETIILGTQNLSTFVRGNQLLDDMDLERERGITIKSHAIQMDYKFEGQNYILNFRLTSCFYSPTQSLIIFIPTGRYGKCLTFFLKKILDGLSA